MESFHEQMDGTDRVIENEKSRCVKVMLVKYKCAIILALVIVAGFQLTYITVKELNTSGVMGKMVEVLLDQSSQQNNTIYALMKHNNISLSETTPAIGTDLAIHEYE